MNERKILMKAIKIIGSIVAALVIVFGALLFWAFSKFLFTLIFAIISIALIARMIYEIINLL